METASSVQKIWDEGQLILNFMSDLPEWQYRYTKDIKYHFYDTPFSQVVDEYDGIEKTGKRVKIPTCNTSFHTSWDWLMRVVDKIESIPSNNGKYWIKIYGNSVDVSDTDICIYPEGKTKIEVVYLSVIAFIKWYYK